MRPWNSATILISKVDRWLSAIPAKRGVVAAASYGARQFGVRSAMPSTVAVRKCAELIFVPPRFEVYRAVSRQIHAIFKTYTVGLRLRLSVKSR